MNPFQYNDGGRAFAGFKSKRIGDCVIRAVAIATETPYREVYRALMRGTKPGKGCSKRDCRNGINIHTKNFRAYLRSKGWVWQRTTSFGQPCKVHLNAQELPPGKLIVSTRKHTAAFISGTVMDTYDSSRKGTAAVYGYFRKE